MNEISEIVMKESTEAEYESEITNDESKQSILSLEDAILSRIIYSSAVLKSQQKDEPELSMEEKQKIASDLLKKNHAEFLSRFGKYLNTNLLEYFSVVDKDNYEVVYHVNRLKRYFDNSTRGIDTKNRRYEALKILIEKGEYFSETAMMNRNPLLYDNLVGKYLTEDQREARDSINEKENTLVNRLMKGIERYEADELKKRQEDAENDVMEENDSDSESEEEVDSDESDKKSVKNENKSLVIDSNVKEDKSSLQWGEVPKSNEEVNEKDEENMSTKVITREFISSKEQEVLREEFVTHMYQSFLNGKDTEFDYSTVDENEIYDNIELKTHDEEEKYFDSESPEWVASPRISDKIEEDESEDELDKYMNSLKEQSHTNHPRKSPS